ncbi:hypothetical protein GDO81_026126 [Engystomops pustulosus]|uniref:Uncharacterized protein n=1 Tax=Engystomops pustulosus TaxID=76066 RepID=A0AAV6YZR6_ENGPU|nr:hypothetical protein GDO81_022201 [Engystomops pustulosus]KAG8542779.1 hypothetical protein GDO81_026126 [Engystomops pustulosus]
MCLLHYVDPSVKGIDDSSHKLSNLHQVFGDLYLNIFSNFINLLMSCCPMSLVGRSAGPQPWPWFEEQVFSHQVH